MRTGNLLLLGFALVSPALADKDAALRASQERKFTKAFREWRVLAEKGDVEAQFRLGAMFDKGEGTRAQPGEAMNWYRIAAYQGHSKAQCALGLMYAAGKGAPRNYVRAYMWLSLASASSEQEAARQRDLLGREMSPAQIVEAQALARSWEPAFRPGNGCGTTIAAGEGTEDVSAPIVLSHVDPEYSEAARNARITGTVLLDVIVDSKGQVRDIRILRGIGWGLEEKAAEAVSKWKFRPGSRNGEPAAVQTRVEVNFQQGR